MTEEMIDKSLPDIPSMEVPRMIEGKPFNIRAYAYIIDFAIIYGCILLLKPLLNNLLVFLLSLIASSFHITFQFGKLTSLSQFISGFFIILFYLVIFEWILGASPGKMILRLRVVQLDGSPCKFWPAIVRGAYRLIDSLIFGLPALMTMHPPLHQRLGDKVAKTLVVSLTDAVNPRKIFSWRLVLVICLYPVMSTVVSFGDLATHVTQIQYLVTANAGQINLTATDLGTTFKKTSEYGKEDFSGKSYFDVNERNFIAQQIIIQSAVFLMHTYPGGTDLVLRSSFEDIIRSEFKDETIQFDKTDFASVGSRSWILWFTNQSTGNEGIGIVFTRENAYVRLILYGAPGSFTQDQSQSLAKVIDQRILTGRFPPMSGEPSTLKNSYNSWEARVVIFEANPKEPGYQ